LAIAGLAALAVWTPVLLPKLEGRIVTVDLAAQGSLANWFSSLVLLSAAVAALEVYAVRRHKVDDYHGRYRIWLWAAACCFLMASDAATGGHEAARQIAVSTAGTRVIGDGSIWWVVPAVLLFTAVGSRLLMDMWPCRLSVTALAAAAIAFVVALAVSLGWLAPQSATHRLLVGHGTLLGGHWLLLSAFVLHARYVILDAEGRLHRRTAKAVRERRKKPQPSAVENRASAANQDKPKEQRTDGGAEQGQGPHDPWVTVASPAGTASPVLKRVVPPTAAPSSTDRGTAAAAGQQAGASGASATAPPASKPVAAAPATSGSAAEKLSKADRKALRQRLLDQRLQREQHKTSAWGK
jgi:hypothetical protein